MIIPHNVSPQSPSLPQPNLHACTTRKVLIPSRRSPSFAPKPPSSSTTFASRRPAFSFRRTTSRTPSSSPGKRIGRLKNGLTFNPSSVSVAGMLRGRSHPLWSDPFSSTGISRLPKPLIFRRLSSPGYEARRWGAIHRRNRHGEYCYYYLRQALVTDLGSVARCRGSSVRPPK